MKLDSIIKAIDRRIAELENKKEELKLKQMSAKRKQLTEEDYETELNKLYLIKYHGEK